MQILPPRMPFTDARTGIISREWHTFLRDLFNRVGGTTGADTAEIEFLARRSDLPMAAGQLMAIMDAGVRAHDVLSQSAFAQHPQVAQFNGERIIENMVFGG